MVLMSERIKLWERNLRTAFMMKSSPRAFFFYIGYDDVAHTQIDIIY